MDGLQWKTHQNDGMDDLGVPVFSETSNWGYSGKKPKATYRWSTPGSPRF